MVLECMLLQKDASLPGVGGLKWVKIMLIRGMLLHGGRRGFRRRVDYVHWNYFSLWMVQRGES